MSATNEPASDDEPATPSVHGRVLATAASPAVRRLASGVRSVGGHRVSPRRSARRGASSRRRDRAGAPRDSRRPSSPRCVHLPNESRVPGAPDAAGSIFTRSSASFTPRGRQRVGVGERVQQHRREVAVHDRHAVLGAPAVAPRRTGRGTPGRRGCPRRTGRARSSPGSRSTSIGLIHAFWNAVPMNRGGSQSELLERRVDEDDRRSRSRSARSRCDLRLVQLAHGVADVLGGLRDRLLGDDADALARQALAEDS